MRYNVSQLLKENTGSTRQFEVDEVLPSPDPDWGEQLEVSGPVTLVRTPSGILVAATLKTAIADVCARCVEPLIEPLDVEIEAEFFPTVDVWSGVAVAVPDDPEVFAIDKRHVLDLTDAFRQGVLVAREMRPLCRPDCRGLCPQCGTNLNNGQCSCDTAPGDPRWGALRRRSA